MGRGKKVNFQRGVGRGIFVSATDTGVGKTIGTYCLAILLREKGYSVGVIKPVQCGGNDAQFLKESLQLDEPLSEINSFSAKQPLSPHLAFRNEKIKFDFQKIKRDYQTLLQRYDFVLVEGAGGLSVPITENYLVLDLVKDLDADLLIISRLGLGTINHTLLTVNQARQNGINVCGILFNESKKQKHGIPEKTNPTEIARLSGVEVLGTIPYLGKVSQANVLRTCSKINLKPILKGKISAGRNQLLGYDKKYVWHPFTQMQDWLNEEHLVIDRAKGNYLIDTQGRRYLDGVSSLWVTVHGHSKREINEALAAQVSRLDHSTMLGLSNAPAVELAKKLVDIAPQGLEKVFYSDNGSTAVEVAIKMAYQYWQNVGEIKRTQIAHLKNSYHGDTLGSVSVGGIDLFHKVYRHLTFKTIELDFNNIEQELIAQRKSIAALVVEPLIQGAAGMIVWPKGLLKRLELLCRKHDIFLIADEVATGFGRTGTMFACEQEKVHPDFLCLAKGLSGGVLPLAATLTTKRVFDGFLFDYKEQKTFFHGHTYTGNPIACAAALANLRIFEKERTLRGLQPKIKHLAKRLKMFYNLRSVGEIRQKGFMVGIELVKDSATKEPFDWKDKVGVKVCQKVRERGVILRPLGNVIVLMPPLSISIEDLDQLLDVTYWAVKTVTII